MPRIGETSLNLHGKVALVTGASGFIGANLTRALLHHGAEVHILCRMGSNLIRLSEILPLLHLHRVDLLQGELLSEICQSVKPNYLFHLAFPSSHPTDQKSRARMIQEGVLGCYNLIEAVTPLEFEKLIYFGSSTEYGFKQKPMQETDFLEPATVRGAYKAACTILFLQFARAHRCPLVVLRPFSVFGFWEAPWRLIPAAILAALLDRELSLTQPGFMRDLIFVEDVVEASLSALSAENVSGRVFNIGSGVQWKNEQVVELIQTLSMREFRSRREIKLRVGAYPASPSDTDFWVADIRQARESLGWAPRHTLVEGLEKTMLWIQRNLDTYLAWEKTKPTLQV